MDQTYTVGGKTFCSKCGHELQPGIKFCRGCGAPVNVPQTPQPSTLQTPALSPSNPTNSGSGNGQQAPVIGAKTTAAGQPLRVIAMQKKFTLVACLKDLLLPGHGFIYTEKMVEGGLVGLITIPLSVWAVIHFIQLWMSDVLSNLRNVGGYGYSPDYSTSSNFLTGFLIVSVIWFGIRCIWLWYSVNEHNKQITNLADISQIVAFVDGK